MDRDSRPYQIAETKWRTVFNFRHNGGLKQLPRKKVVYDLGATTPILYCGGFPRDSHSVYAAATASALYQIQTDGTTHTATRLGDLAAVSEHFSSAYYNGQVYLTSPSNPAFYTDGSALSRLYDNRWCWTKDSGEDITGDGPYTLDPIRNASDEITGDLGASFTWTAGRYYRVYVTKPRAFAVGFGIQVDQVESGYSDTGMAGTVLAVERDYVKVKATNTKASVRNLKGATAAKVSTVQADMPSGRYIKVFFDHLVIGAPSWKGRYEPWKIRWSHLKDFAEWEARTDTEADSYTCSEFQHHGELVEGVTGVEMFGDSLLVFTASSIYMVNYTGLPRVVQVVPAVRGYGNGLLYATAALNNAVAFCDVSKLDFCLYRGGTEAESIGQGIRDYFFTDLNPDPTYAQKTWTFVDKSRDEVGWVYVQTGATDFNRMVVWNYKYNEWSARSAENLYCFSVLGRRQKSIAELTGTCSAQVGVAGSLGNTSTILGAVWGNRTGQLLAEASATDLEASLLAQTQPYLETGDFIFGGLQTKSEVDAIALSATSSVNVYVSARGKPDDTVTWTSVGTWTSSMPTLETLTFSAKDGNVLRFKFEPVQTVAGCLFSLFETNDYNVGSER